MNVVCLIEDTYTLLEANTALQTWSDTTSLENHLFKFAVDEEYINAYYPQVLIHNDYNTVNYVSNVGFEWTNAVLVEFTDSPNRYLNEDSTKMKKVGDLLCEFQRNVDAVIQEFACNTGIFNMPINTIKLVDIGIASSEVSSHEAGRVLKSMYTIEYWG